MPVTYVYTENTFAEWRFWTNVISANVGDLERLEIPSTYPDLVTAINSLYFSIVTVQANAVNAQYLEALLANIEANVNANLNSSNAYLSNLLANLDIKLSNAIANVEANVTANLANVEANLTANLSNAIANIDSNLIITVANVEANVTANIANVSANVANVSNATIFIAANLANVVADVTNVTANVANVTLDLGNTSANVSNVTANVTTLTANVANVTANVTSLTANVANVTADLGNVTADLGNVTADLGNVASNVTDISSNIFGDGTTGSIAVGNIVVSNAYVTGNLQVFGWANISGNLNVHSTLAVADDAFFSNDVVILGNLTVGDLASIISGNGYYSNDLVVDGNIYGNIFGWADRVRYIDNFTTANIREDTDANVANTDIGNIYFTNTRSRAAVGVTGVGISYNPISGLFSLATGQIGSAVLSAANTDELPEGESNLYYTDARAQAWFEGNITFQSPLIYDNATGIVALTLVTDNVPESNDAVNLYFTEARARAALSDDGGNIIYDPSTGIISANLARINGVTAFNGAVGDLTITSDEIPEGVANLYFSLENWLARLGTITTDNIAEGNVNLYYSNEKVWNAFITSSSIILDNTNGYLSVDVDGLLNSVVMSINGANGNVVLYTSNIAENPNVLLANTTVGNVYFTNSRVYHALNPYGQITLDKTTGDLYVPGPYGIYYRKFYYTLAASTNTISGVDLNGHTLTLGSASATDVWVNGIKLREVEDFVVNNSYATSNVVFTTNLPIGTEVTIQELTGNLAVAQGYVIESRTDYTENVSVYADLTTYNLDLNYGTNTVFKVNITDSTTFTFVNPPVVGRALVFTVFTNFSGTNQGLWTLTWPNNVRWDDNSPPQPTASPNRLEAYTFYTLDGGTLYYGYKNLSDAPNS